MIQPEYYHLIYILVLSVLLLMVGRRYSTYPPLRLYSREKENPLPSLIVMTVLVIYLGLRPVDKAFGDTVMYDFAWNSYKAFEFDFSLGHTNFLFENLFSLMVSTGMDVKFFFLTMDAIYLGVMWMAVRKMFPNDTLFVYLVALTAMSTYSYGVNGIKAGAASSLFLLALAYEDNRKISIPLIIASLGFHHSMSLVICSYIAISIVRNPKYYFVFWASCCFMAIAHITVFQSLFARFADSGGQVYLSDWGVTKFRGDFILYSAMPVVVGYFAFYKKGIRSGTYTTVLNLYLLTNSIWMLCMYALYTNRIAYLSWFLYPIVLIYPFLKEEWGDRQYHIGKLVAYAQMVFTVVRIVIFGKG